MKPTTTPWGTSQHATEIAPGIVLYETSSHGGFHLDQDRQKHVKRTLPDFQTFAGGPWYEEDCDAAVVALMFPDVFPGQQEDAEKSVRMFAAWEHGHRYRPVVAWLDAQERAAA